MGSLHVQLRILTFELIYYYVTLGQLNCLIESVIDFPYELLYFFEKVILIDII